MARSERCEPDAVRASSPRGPGHSRRIRSRSPRAHARRAAPARPHALLRRRRRGRPRGRRAHDAVRHPRSRIGLYRPVLELATETARATLAIAARPFAWSPASAATPRRRVAEAEIAAALGYDAGLLSLGGWRTRRDDELLDALPRVAEVIPLFGFYLQPAVGGRVLATLLARVRRDPERVGDQDRAVQPLSDARRRARRRRSRAATTSRSTPATTTTSSPIC